MYVGERLIYMLSGEKIGKIKSVLEELEEIDAAYIYGSRARNEEYEGSDTDIGLLLNEKFSPPTRYPVRVAREIENRTGLRDIDARILNGKDPRFLQSVLSNSKLIFSRNDDHRIDFESTSLVKYLDMKPVFEERKEMIKRRMSE